MDRQNQAIRKLLTGPHSIFRYSGIQYPNEKEQKYLLAYSMVYKILRDEKQPDRIFQQLIFKSLNNIRQLVQGLLYLSLLNPQLHRQVFSHIQLFRADAMKLYADCVTDLLNEDFENLKEQSVQLFPQIFQDLSKYKLLTEDMVVILLKTVNPVNTSERHMNYAWKVFEVLVELIKETKNIRGFGRYLFLKLLKMLTVLYVLVEEEGSFEFREDCLKNVLLLWKADSVECLFCGNQVFRYFQELIPYVNASQDINQFIQQYKALYSQNERTILSLSPIQKQKILGINLSNKTTHILHFMSGADPQQMNYQFNWLYQSYEQNKTFDFVVIDMLRYILRAINKDSKYFMIDRIVSYCFGKPVLFEYVRQAVFFDWFIYEALPDDKICEMAAPGLRVLEIFRLSMRPQIAEKMLQYILQQHIRTQEKLAARIKQNVKRIFLIGERRGLLRLDDLLAQPSISPQIKKQLVSLMATAITPSQDYNPFAGQHANPDIELDVGSPSSLELSRNATQIWQEEDYEGDGSMKTEDESLNDYLELAIQKEYVEEGAGKLNSMLEKPNKDTYTQLIDHIVTLIKKSSVKKEEDVIKMLYNETVKVTYVIFQSHFEEFWIVDKDANIIGYMIDKMHSFWGPISQELRFLKWLVKQLGRLFKIVPYAVLYIFLFRIGNQRAHSKQMLAFLLEGSSKQQMLANFALLIEDKDKLAELSLKTQSYRF